MLIIKIKFTFSQGQETTGKVNELQKKVSFGSSPETLRSAVARPALGSPVLLLFKYVS